MVGYTCNSSAGETETSDSQNEAMKVQGVFQLTAGVDRLASTSKYLLSTSHLTVQMMGAERL